MKEYLNLKPETLVNIINDLLIEKKFNDNEIEFINKAIVFATEKHKNQLRKSNEPYIIHPLCTAIYLIEINMDVDTIVAGIMHDLLEDTNTKAEEIKELFNEDVLKLVKMVTKVTETSKENRNYSVDSNDNQNNQYLIDLLLSMSTDPRAMIIKLADRLHNIYTLNHLSENKQIRIATETLNIFANIAGRFGMYNLKTELLDLSFQYINKKQFSITVNNINKLVELNNDTWLSVLNKIRTILNSYNISFSDSYRYKGVYSTYLKVQRKYDISEIHDIFAIRIIVDDILDCYKVLGIIHTNFKYIPQAFKDYISTPKLNLYQSIHTTILTKKSILEIQIRTKKMDHFANYGLAAHWIYKDNNIMDLSQVSTYINKYVLPNANTSDFDKDIATLSETITPYDVFIKNDDSIIITNSKNTLLDIAYMYKKDKFPFLSMIKLNGLEKSFDTFPNKNDVIEFFYNDEYTIKTSWINYAISDTTKKFIKDTLLSINDDKNIKNDEFYKFLDKTLKHKWIGKGPTNKLLSKYHFSSLSNFLKFIKDEKIDMFSFVNLFSKIKNDFRTTEPIFSLIYSKYLLYKNYLTSQNEFAIKKIEFPLCCNKLPGDNIFGFYSYNILFVHNINCKIYKKIRNKHTIYPLEWNVNLINKENKLFKYLLVLTTGYSNNLSNFIAQQLINNKIQFNKIDINNVNNQTCYITLELLINNIKQVNELLTLFKSFNIKLR